MRFLSLVSTRFGYRRSGVYFRGGATTASASGTALNVIDSRTPRESPSNWQAAGPPDEVIRRPGRSSSVTRCLNSNFGRLANICRTTRSVGIGFMLVGANTPSPDSKLQPGLVHTGRSLANVHGLEFDTNAKLTPGIGSRPGRSRVSIGSRRV